MPTPSIPGPSGHINPQVDAMRAAARPEITAAFDADMLGADNAIAVAGFRRQLGAQRYPNLTELAAELAEACERLHAAARPLEPLSEPERWLLKFSAERYRTIDELARRYREEADR